MTPIDATGEFANLLAVNSINLNNCGMDFDPPRRQFALWCGDGRVWMIKAPTPLSPSGWIITKQRTPTLAIPNGNPSTGFLLDTGILGKWKYIYNLDAFIGLQDASQGNIWVYKPVGWQNPQGGGTVVLQDGNNGYNLTRDTYLDSYHKTTSLGSAAFMQDYYFTGTYTDLVRFAVFQSEGGPVPNGAVIQSAQLSLYKFTSYNMTYAVNRVLANWSEASATWQQRDIGLLWGTPGAQGAGVDYQASADAQASVGFNPDWVTFDVTSAIQQMSGGQPNYGWKLIGLSGYLSGVKRFYTREYAADPTLRPKLVITYQ